MLEIPDGFEAQVRPRSGLAIRQGLTVVNAPGTIDSDYRGELKVLLVNLGAEAGRRSPRRPHRPAGDRAGDPGRLCRNRRADGIRPRRRRLRFDGGVRVEILVLASGSSGNCALVRAGGVSVLVDAGVSALQIAKRLEVFGCSPDEVDAVLLTHEHSDHIRGLEVFLRRHRDGAGVDDSGDLVARSRFAATAAATSIPGTTSRVR